MIKVAIQAGLAKDEASKFVSYMIKGSGFLLSHSGKSAIDLREEVTSPGGTTEAALKVLLKDSSFKTIISNAVLEAIKKSKEISDNH